jgi:hypothetical protein
LKAASLIIKYLHNSLNRRERNELDEWVTASDENEALFYELTDSVDDTVFSADNLIVETEQLLDLWNDSSFNCS